MEPQCTFTIGRSPDCDIHLGDDSVSRHHATLSLSDDGRWLLKDSGSKYKTFIINSDRAVVVRETDISSTDTLRFGNLTVTARELLEEVWRKFPRLSIPWRESRGEKVRELLANFAWVGIGALAAVLTVTFIWVWG
uniref:FHA domain-containing protein n=1 Tax=Candidatus Kentrum sp. FM TaxID=2126340 RepID=A0A450RXU1_9GAMM|nr:MAG: FHA domain-containing protein [Candidatus Kentron sp. FM]VFJ43932.1 MAG: FHA domain-containing protein [Candidatus Kentron sp. FM]VFK07339.1 MAG: FHA domain-containing protein [Candidatus Kentron sp. FM]